MLFCEILDPLALLDHICAHSALDPICALTNGIQGNDANVGKPAQTESQRHTADPYKTAVKQEGDHGLTAGAQGEVGGIGIGIEGHHNSTDQNQRRCQMAHIVCSVVEQGEHVGEYCHDSTEETARDHRE